MYTPHRIALLCFPRGLPRLGGRGDQKTATYKIHTLSAQMQEYFPRTAASARQLVRSEGGISSVCTVCVWTTAWTTLITHMSYITIPRYNTTSWRALPQLAWGETGGGWQRAGKGPWQLVWPTRGPRQQGQPRVFCTQARNKVLPRQEAGPPRGVLYVATYILSLFLSPNPFGFGGSCWGNGGGRGGG